MPYQIVTDAFRAHVLAQVYEPTGVEPIGGKQLLAARHKTTNVGIYILRGAFDRDAFKLAIAEAKAAGIRHSRLYVYADLCTYSGPGIQFAKFDEMGISLPEAEAAPVMGQ